MSNSNCVAISTYYNNSDCRHLEGIIIIYKYCTTSRYHVRPGLPHLKHIGKDKQVGKNLPLLSHCKQPNDPGEAHHRDEDDGGLEQTPLVNDDKALWYCVMGYCSPYTL